MGRFLSILTLNMHPSRITLRPFTTSDTDDLFSWASDDRMIKSLRWKTITSKEEAFNFIQQICIPHPWRRSICINDRSIGFVSVFPGSGDDRCRADIGYAIAVEYWGVGNHYYSCENGSSPSV